MPVLAITDLMIKHDDLIVATQGRSFWILDDMGLIRQLNGESGTKLYNPENSTIGNWYSQLNSNYSDGTILASAEIPEDVRKKVKESNKPNIELLGTEDQESIIDFYSTKL